MRLNLVLVVSLAVSLVLSACAYDPIDKPGTWRVPPKGLTSNDENLRAMLVNPRDMVKGRGEAGGVGATSAAAARRLLTGHRPALPVATARSGSATSQPQAREGAGMGAAAKEE